MTNREPLAFKMVTTQNPSFRKGRGLGILSAASRLHLVDDPTTASSCSSEGEAGGREEAAGLGMGCG